MAYRISSIKHPEYLAYEPDFLKFRLTYKGGRVFKDHFLEQFSKREPDGDFLRRKRISYSPSFAKSAINDIKNSIYQRMAEISRIGGDVTYRDAINGENGGVDLYGCSMNGFIGQEVLPELLIMGKVGIYVDKPALDGQLIAGNEAKKPYLYSFTAEDILSWDYSYENGEYVYWNVLLRFNEHEYDDKTGLPTANSVVYRHFWVTEDKRVMMSTWEEAEKATEDDVITSTIELPLSRIPFVVLSLSGSLLEDIADYQIALLNIASSDINYIYRANFPIWTEQYDPATEPIYNRALNWKAATTDTVPSSIPAEITEAQGQTSSPVSEKRVGALTGVRYPIGSERPAFIAPPTDPVKASMEKQQQMQEEIRLLINLSLATVKANHASAESKKMDSRGKEDGLAAIGLELEYGENEIAKIWAEYQNTEVATIKYPEKYDLKSDTDKIALATSLKELKGAAPSRTFQKEVGKQIATTMLRGKATPETIQTVLDEIDSAAYVTSEAADIQLDIESGLVSAETASDARGYDGSKEVPIAKKEHLEKLKAIAVAQAPGGGAARGTSVGPQDSSADSEKKASQDPALNPTGGGSLTRGKA